MKKVLLATAFVAAAFAAQAQTAAAPNWFGEIGYSFQKISATDGIDTIKASPNALNLSVGYKVHPNVAIEGVAGIGMSPDHVKLNGVDTVVDGKLDSVLGIYVRPSVMVSDSLELFARLGYARTKVTLSAGGLNVSGSDNDFSYGVGASYALSKSTYVSGNWTSFYNKDGFKASGLSVSYGMRF